MACDCAALDGCQLFITPMPAAPAAPACITGCSRAAVLIPPAAFVAIEDSGSGGASAAIVALEATAPGKHSVLGLPLFIDRFVQVNNITQQALVSDALGLQGCAALGLLEPFSPSPGPPPTTPSPAPEPTAPSPAPEPSAPSPLPSPASLAGHVAASPALPVVLAACLLGWLALPG